MFDSILNFFKKLRKENKKDSKDTAKERLHLVLMQDRANVSADFMELMKQEIIEVIKKYIDVDENSIDVKLTNKVNSDGTTGAPFLYANIPILNVKDDTKQIHIERKLQKGQEEQKQEKTEKENREVENKKEQNENVEEGKIHKNEEKNSESEAQKQAQEVKNMQQKDAQVVNFEQEENKQVENNEKEANSEQEKELEEKVQEVDQKQETLAEKNEEQKQEEDKNSNHVEV